MFTWCYRGDIIESLEFDKGHITIYVLYPILSCNITFYVNEREGSMQALFSVRRENRAGYRCHSFSTESCEDLDKEM